MRGRTGRAAGTVALAVAMISAACSGDSGSDTTTTTAAPTSEATTSTTGPLAEGTLGTIELTTTKVAEVDEPVALVARPSTPDLYVVERGGRLRLVKVTKPTTGTGPPRYQLQNTPVVDLTDEVLDDGKE
jgi:glucose/arabinose dehydrogenase